MRMQLITAYLNAVCDMVAAESPEEADLHAKEIDALFAGMTAEEIAYTEEELESGKWIKWVSGEELGL